MLLYELMNQCCSWECRVQSGRIVTRPHYMLPFVSASVVPFAPLVNTINEQSCPIRSCLLFAPRLIASIFTHPLLYCQSLSMAPIWFAYKHSLNWLPLSVQWNMHRPAQCHYCHFSVFTFELMYTATNASLVLSSGNIDQGSIQMQMISKYMHANTLSTVCLSKARIWIIDEHFSKQKY